MSDTTTNWGGACEQHESDAKMQELHQLIEQSKAIARRQGQLDCIDIARDGRDLLRQATDLLGLVMNADSPHEPMLMRLRAEGRNLADRINAILTQGNGGVA